MRKGKENRTTDEELVNKALLSFPRALTLKIPNIGSEWTGHRIALKARFATDEYEARTDGYLDSKQLRRHRQSSRREHVGTTACRT